MPLGCLPPIDRSVHFPQTSPARGETILLHRRKIEKSAVRAYKDVEVRDVAILKSLLHQQIVVGGEYLNGVFALYRIDPRRQLVVRGIISRQPHFHNLYGNLTYLRVKTIKGFRGQSVMVCLSDDFSQCPDMSENVLNVRVALSAVNESLQYRCKGSLMFFRCLKFFPNLLRQPGDVGYQGPRAVPVWNTN